MSADIKIKHIAMKHNYIYGVSHDLDIHRFSIWNKTWEFILNGSVIDFIQHGDHVYGIDKSLHLWKHKHTGKIFY